MGVDCVYGTKVQNDAVMSCLSFIEIQNDCATELGIA